MPEEITRNVLVRPAERRDVPWCADIFLDGRREAFPGQASALFRWDDYVDCVAGEDVWVADVQGRVVGFASLARSERMVRNLFVDAPWRSRGVGARLMDGVLGSVTGVVFLRCAARNHRARAFYERTGWEEAPAAATARGDFILFRRSADLLPL